ncbi:efflux RND transporter permease subunit [Balneolales bacterium ANBcel1]|nr:efflux RND transporter permease subunit [Balneolales bacterium ANBcel1]
MPKIAVEKPVTTTMVFVAIFVLGMVSLFRLPVDLLPEIEPPIISVITSYPGAGAEDVERNVTEPLERVLATVSDIKEIRSTSEDHVSLITLEFDWGVNLDIATNDIRDQLELSRQGLPDGADFPIIFKIDTGLFPVAVGSFTANESYFEIRELIDTEVGDAVRRLPGVGTVFVSGGPTREIQVEVDPVKLEAYNLDLSMVNQIIAAENINMPVGNIKMGLTDYNIRVPGEFNSVHELEDIVLGRSNGEVLYLRDVATIRDGYRDVTQEVRINGEQGAAIIVMKQSDANTVTVAREALRVIEEQMERLPADVNFSVMHDGSDFVLNAIFNLATALVAAAVFVILIVLFFLRRLKATIIIASTLPFSLIGAFIFLDLSGNTLNMITLSSLAIAIGMVVDDAIVILENITTKIERGSRVTEAAIYGSSEVGLAVFATTLAVVAVFLPLTFLSGIAGIMFSSIGALVSITVVVSTIAALTLIPMLASKFLKPREEQEKADKKFERITGPLKRFLDGLHRVYKYSLIKTLHYRKTTIAVCLLIFGSSLAIVPMLGTEFIPAADDGQLEITMEFDSGQRLEETLKANQQVEEWIREQYGDILRIIQTEAGASDEGGIASLFGAGGSNIAEISVRFVSKTERDKSIFEIAEEVRRYVAGIPGLYSYNVSDGGGMGAGTAAIELQLRSDDLETTLPLAYEIASRTENIPGARNVEVSIRPERPELIVRPDRQKISQLGLNTATIANSLNLAVQGSTTSRYREAGEEYDIRVRIPESYRNTISRLESIPIHTAQGMVVRLSDVATVEESTTAPQINRVDQERVVSVTLDNYDRTAGEIVEDMEAMLAEMEIPRTIGIHFGGEYETQMDAFGDLLTLLILCTFLVFAVMASQFENYRDPFIIMFSIPFSFTGVFLALLITGLPLSIMAFLAAILLIGIVVKNAIVLVDYVNIFKKRGMTLRTAVIEGSTDRLRPVLMTAFTTMLAMLPLALSTGEGSETWQPLGIAVIGGLLFSTFITMYLVPVLYTYAKREKLVA